MRLRTGLSLKVIRLVFLTTRNPRLIINLLPGQLLVNRLGLRFRPVGIRRTGVPRRLAFPLLLLKKLVRPRFRGSGPPGKFVVNRVIGMTRPFNTSVLLRVPIRLIVSPGR